MTTNLSQGIVNDEYTAGITDHKGRFLNRREIRARIMAECRKCPWYRNPNRQSILEHLMSPAFLEPLSGCVIAHVAQRAADADIWMEGL